VLVTGADGFIGSAVTRALLDDGYEVVTLVQPGTDRSNTDDLQIDRVVGDVRDLSAVREAVQGCRGVFHVAALYRFWAPDPHDFYAVNVEGTRNVLAAVSEGGVDRVVYTGTVGTLGLDPKADGGLSNEDSYPDPSHLFGSYKRSKYVAEHEVLRAAAQGCPVSIVLPTFPLGPRDRAPTPTGRLVLDFLNGRMPGYIDTVLNAVHVDDVARGHVLAFERGATGRSYILGGQNLTLRDLLLELAALTGLPESDRKVPRPVAAAAAWISDTVEGRLLGRHPHVPLEAFRMSSTRMAFDDRRARRELGYASRPAIDAIEASARWFVDNGYVSSKRSGLLRWRRAGDPPVAAKTSSESATT
jgi:dihydroflavonol-4-reductase